MMSLGVVFFMSLVFGVHWASWICEFVVFIKYGKFSIIMFSNIFFYPHPPFRNSSYMYSWPLNNTRLNYMDPLIHRFFFNSKYYGTTWSAVSWICGYRGTVYVEEPQIWGSKYKIRRFLTVHRVGVPIPTLFKGQLYIRLFEIVQVQLTGDLFIFSVFFSFCFILDSF